MDRDRCIVSDNETYADSTDGDQWWAWCPPSWHLRTWIWLRSHSIWIVCLAHGALNAWGQHAFKYMDDLASEKNVWLLVTLALTQLALGALTLARIGNAQHASAEVPTCRATSQSPRAA